MREYIKINNKKVGFFVLEDNVKNTNIFKKYAIACFTTRIIQE